LGFLFGFASLKAATMRAGILASVLSILWLSSSASADVVLAADNASNAAYNDGWQVGDNGGSGFGAWSVIGNQSGSGFGGGFLSTGNSSVSIGSGGNNAAWGIFGNSGGVGQAVRAFSTPLAVGATFSIDMDNQNIDTGGTVGFGLRNSSGDNLFEFYFVGGQSNYTVNAKDVSGATPGFTASGLRLALSLTGSNAFTFTIDTLGNGIGVDYTVLGHLLDNVDQSITTLRAFNANGGPDVFYNNLVVSVPESSAICVLAALGVAGVILKRRVA
jgi:type II secretory pathway pseudopilin PulG